MMLAIQAHNVFHVCDRFSKMKCFSESRHHIFRLRIVLLRDELFRHTKIFHFRIVFKDDELFQAHNVFSLENCFSKMNSFWRTKIFHFRIAFHTRWIVPGSRRTTYFHLRIVFLRFSKNLHDELFQAHKNIPFEDRFSKMNCSRRTTYFHMRIVFLHDELFQASTT